MAETSNIAEMAEILSNELFAEFLWQRSGPTNFNWPCEEVERHKASSHPSDVVFCYDNPYSLSRTYVNCDLKSYGSGSIKAGTIASAIEGLARSLNCAEKSGEWQKTYIHEHVSPEICGLLFVYNHDGNYDKDFKRLLGGVKPQLIDIPQKSKIVVLGPEDIFWLSNVRYEILQMRGKGELPPREDCHFFYPNLIRRNNVQPERARAATLEALTAPWIILSYIHPDEKYRKGFVIFYRRRGESVQEFLYLMDYLMHYQVIVDHTDVKIRTLDTGLLAPTQFKKAVDEYVDECDSSEEIKSRLDEVGYAQISQIQTRFSEIEIGMSND